MQNRFTAASQHRFQEVTIQTKLNLLACDAGRIAGLSISADPQIAQLVPDQPIFVIRARDLELLETLQDQLPRPLSGTWINRGTGSPLRRSTIAMLLRTLGCVRALNPSVQQLQHHAGLRLVFASTTDRQAFARVWRAAS